MGHGRLWSGGLSRPCIHTSSYLKASFITFTALGRSIGRPLMNMNCFPVSPRTPAFALDTYLDRNGP